MIISYCRGCIGLVLFITATASARGQEPASSNLLAGQPPKYSPGDVNLAVSKVYTFVDKTGLGHQHAIEGKLSSGSLRLNVSQDAGQLVFDMTSFNADTRAARRYLGLEGETPASTREQVNENMRGEAVLDVQRYPTATFDVRSVLPLNESSDRGLPLYTLEGTFTLHGVKRPLSLSAEVSQARGWLNLRGNFTVKQTDFGITPYSKAFGAVGVANAIRIHGDLWVVPTADLDLKSFPERK